MTSYLAFPSRALADQRNAAEAMARGCTGDVTAYWWATVVNATTGQAALQIAAGDEGTLSAAEIASLVPSFSLG